jgi:succinate-semialdehyde dehydrogenase/glutarate-semialdehyde dehydrogenase
VTRENASQDAIDSARRAQPAWGALDVRERAERLARAVPRILDSLDDHAARIHAENGKPLAEAIAHELIPAIATLRWLEQHAHSVLAPTERRVAWLPHRRAAVERRPYGVVLVISPWNIPFLIPFTQVVTALAAGNTVVLKPSEVTPRCADLIGELLDLPEDVLRIEQGDGRVGAALVDARPDKILFTGSVATGRRVMAAAARHPIPVALELGGADVLVVRHDADLELAASAIAWGATFNHGQVCASVERVLADRKVAAELQARVTEKLGRISRTNDFGRVTYAPQREVLDRHLDDAVARGLVACGGEWLDEQRLSPTLLAGAEAGRCLAWHEESFGPIVVLDTFATDDEAVERHNASRLGLTASIFSRDVKAAAALGRRLLAGNVAINEIAAMHYSQPELPWGGRGESGFGRSHGPEGLLDVTWPQVIDTAAVRGVEPKRPWWYPYDHDQLDALRALAEATAASAPAHKARALASAAGRFARSLSRSPRT